MSSNLTWRTVRQLRGLCFDIENKPGTYGPGDYTHPKITAIAWASMPEPDHPYERDIKARVFRRNDHDHDRAILEEFRAVYDQADFIMGHNLRRHDVKILNGFYMARGLPLLEPKRAVDTYLDQPKVAGLSRSLANLAARWRCPIQKMDMPEHVWEEAYDGVPYAVDMMRERARSDVAINLWLYRELLDRDLLRL